MDWRLMDVDSHPMENIPTNDPISSENVEPPASGGAETTMEGVMCSTPCITLQPEPAMIPNGIFVALLQRREISNPTNVYDASHSNTSSENESEIEIETKEEQEQRMKSMNSLNSKASSPRKSKKKRRSNLSSSTPRSSSWKVGEPKRNLAIYGRSLPTASSLRWKGKGNESIILTNPFNDDQFYKGSKIMGSRSGLFSKRAFPVPNPVCSLYSA
jgi:hypothetical protein